MTATTIRVQMAQRKDTAANWTAANPILLSGEFGYETNTKKFKLGDGTTNWNSLGYLPIPDSSGNLGIATSLAFVINGTEQIRFTTDGVSAYNQAAPAAVNATATLTIANLKAGIITSTSAAATDMTLPTGTNTEAGFTSIYTNFAFQWSVINTGPSLVRVLAGTAHTVVGSGSVAAGTSGRFVSRRTAANTFVSYQLA